MSRNGSGSSMDVDDDIFEPTGGSSPPPLRSNSNVERMLHAGDRNTTSRYLREAKTGSTVSYTETDPYDRSDTRTVTYTKIGPDTWKGKDTDRNNVIAAWKALHPGKDPNIKTSGLPARKWQQMDKQNAKALADSPYDAIIYKKADGRHEVQIPKSQSDSLKKTNSYKYGGQRFSGNGEYSARVQGPAKGKDERGRTLYRVDKQYYRFDRKRGFVKTRLVKGK